jgi:hypothetical protein
VVAAGARTGSAQAGARPAAKIIMPAKAATEAALISWSSL